MSEINSQAEISEKTQETNSNEEEHDRFRKIENNSKGIFLINNHQINSTSEPKPKFSSLIFENQSLLSQNQLKIDDQLDKPKKPEFTKMRIIDSFSFLQEG